MPIISGGSSGGGAPSGAAGGDLGGNFPNPKVAALTETSGPTSLVAGAVADGAYLKRAGAALVGAAAPVTSVDARTGAVTHAAQQVTLAIIPTLNVSATALMLGSAGAITPVGTTIVVIIVGVYNMLSTTAPLKLEGRYGTGAAPALNAAVTGTAFGQFLSGLETAATARLIPFTLAGLITGLVAGTPVWLDVAFTGDNVNQPQVGRTTTIAFDVAS